MRSYNNRLAALERQCQNWDEPLVVLASSPHSSSDVRFQSPDILYSPGDQTYSASELYDSKRSILVILSFPDQSNCAFPGNVTKVVMNWGDADE